MELDVKVVESTELSTGEERGVLREFQRSAAKFSTEN
jgi:hypothetical protein